MIVDLVNVFGKTMVAVEHVQLMTHQPLALGLNGNPTADFVAIDWSDGVYQSELDLAAGAVPDVSPGTRGRSMPVAASRDSAISVAVA